jgi:hypothetical protein
MWRREGVKVAVSIDAHSGNAFQYMRFGIDPARLADGGRRDQHAIAGRIAESIEAVSA